MAKRKVVARGAKCGPACTVWGIIAAIIIGIGLFILVKGVQMQWGGAEIISTTIWYAVGIFIIGIAKTCKHKACRTCRTI